jgi:bacterioferritin
MNGKVRDPQQIVALFNHNVALEHGALYQYLQHAYAIGEAGVGSEIINIARSEMRHLKYFAGIIVELGGVVTLQRPEVLVRAASIQEMMRLGSQAEDEAIRDYTSQLDVIDHPGALRVLERVIKDEEFHKSQFAGFEEEVADMARTASYPTEGALLDPELVAMLNDSFAHEYNQLLVYLRHYFQTTDWEAKDFLFENAFWRMKHLGLLADHIHDLNADPSFLWNPHPEEGAIADRIAQCREIEQEDTARYQRLSGCPIPEEVRRLFTNMRDHAVYQEGQMRLLQDLMSRPDLAQPGYAPIDQPIPSAESAEPKPSPHGVAAQPTRRPGLTIGSLIDVPPV